ncbi:hypothetical protein QQS21_008897 [Conoideocrella luteorostrata]|uniref:Eukaryotic translation initiation factor 6 n=1 Tax=Conoideocrella luteorostrata TaxID=1105319 RepID=A0AAJ0CI54_9HYPO|nr:hypothetical protein QQS21_008897 [Conoideocrella luteorostrata]
MASGSGAGSGGGSRQNRPRDSSQEEFPPLPRSAPRLPPLRTLNSDRGQSNPPSPSPLSSATLSSIAYSTRAATRVLLAANRRAERVRNIDERASSLDDLESNSLHQPWLSASRRALRSRPAETRSNYYGQPPNFEDLDQSLDAANAQLRTLLDHVNLTAPLLQSTLSPTSRSHDFPDDNLPTKRRKIDSNPLVPSSKGFRYGRYGQVEPGQLQMEIVSCDGGMFSNESSYAAENILKDDNSVYCTKGNRCNIVLRHQGAMVFTLEELTIKAPSSMNFSHPSVREGMVFVSMKQDDMLSRTAQYQIQYTAKPADQIPQHIISIHHHQDGTRVHRSHSHHPPHNHHSHRHRDPLDADRRDHRVAEMPSEFSSNLPYFNITTECTSDDEENELIAYDLHQAPNRIGSLPFETESSDSEDNAIPFARTGFAEAFDRQLPTLSSTGNAYTSHDRERVLTEAWDAHNSATQDAVRAVGGELLVPHARFYIEKKKSKCTIRFDPPVSGRFILLKMWSSHHEPSSNIDIRGVMAKGFAGPRYFPSVQLS